MKIKSNRFSLSQLAIAVIFLLLLTACATKPVVLHDIPELKADTIPDIQSVDLLAVTPEMKEFAAVHASRNHAGDSRAWNLVYASLHPHVLAFDYDPMSTLSGSEAFAQNRGNCLSFSHMFIALARDAGMDAWYQEVKLFPEWDNLEDSALVSMHVNAMLRDKSDEYTIDVSRRERKFSEVSRKMDDSEAEAQHYNNLGVDALVDKDLPRAYAFFRKAIETHPGLAYVWSNLAVTLKRNEQVDDAVIAYQIALEYSPNNNVSLNNLFLIYEERGQMDLAESVAAQVERSRHRNPYYLKFQAELANEEARYDEAVDYSRKAVRLARKDYRLHYTLAQSLYLFGEHDQALASLERARKLAPSPAEADQLKLPTSH